VPPFAPLAPSGWVRLLLSSYCGTPTSRFTRAPRFSLDTRFRLSTAWAGSPKFLGNPCHTCPALRLRWNLPEQASGTSSLRLALSVLPSELWASSASTTSKISEPNHAACVLAVYASCRSLPSAHARLASGWRPCLGRAGFEPAELLTWFLSCLAHMTHLQDEACLAHPAEFWVGSALHVRETTNRALQRTSTRRRASRRSSNGSCLLLFGSPEGGLKMQDAGTIRRPAASNRLLFIRVRVRVLPSPDTAPDPELGAGFGADLTPGSASGSPSNGSFPRARGAAADPLLDRWGTWRRKLMGAALVSAGAQSLRREM
jgi:hypothetical protein